jgi:hypothetical protein
MRASRVVAVDDSPNHLLALSQILLGILLIVMSRLEAYAISSWNHFHD